MVARAGMAPFIVTLAGMLFARGLLQAISHEGQNTYQVPAGSVFDKLGQGSWPPIITVAVLFVLGGVLLARSRFGHNVFAVGGNENAATLMGVAVRRTKVWVYVLSAVLAGVAGPAQRFAARVRRHRHRRRLRADRDRGHRHRRHAALRRRRFGARHRGGRAAARGHPEPDRPVHLAVRLVRVGGRERRVPRRRRAAADLSQSGSSNHLTDHSPLF